MAPDLRLSSSHLVSFAAGALSLAALTTIHRIVTAPRPKSIESHIHPSPLEALPHKLDSHLPYPPTNLLPGARDVPTPYGSIRLYEFGPATATRKALLVHGISNPSIALAPLARHLAARGARVMVLDLFGRGWSGGPVDLPYDGRLYATQILLAISSSDVSWTTGGGFSLIGYSLGGCIGADFTSWFPSLVDDLVLIAPGGLIREVHTRSLRNLLMYTGMLPDWLVARLVARRLVQRPNVRLSPSAADKPQDAQSQGADVVAAEIPSGRTRDAQAPDPEAVVAWQIERHRGFVPSFVSSIRFAPTQNQHARWRLIGARMDAARAARASRVQGSTGEGGFAAVDEGGLRSGQVLMVLGEHDSIIIKDELVPDASAAFGEENLAVVAFDAGHELPFTHSEGIAEAIWSHWEGN